jgi:dihydrofolate synthase/folylpolyglutamate synthase
MASDSRYTAFVRRLFQSRRHGVKLSLERMERALHRLDRPDRRIPLVIQIGGTNGKGSTATFVASILRAAGFSTGLYTSPHLERFAERFQVDGVPLPPDVIARAGAVVERQDREQELTFFEQTTLLAAVAFAELRVDAAVFEVGLGGRFDATTALRADVCAVTGVALDHERILGDTLEQIAFEKAGIFRRGVPAVIGRSGEAAATPWLIAGAERAGANPIVVVSSDEPLGTLGLLGPHQNDNARLARAVVAAVPGRRFTSDCIERGLASARLPGRLELLENVWLDGAHNPAGARALALAMERLQLPRPRHLIFGVSADKNCGAMAEALAPVIDRVYVTAAASDRALPVDQAALCWCQKLSLSAVSIHASTARALSAARSGAASVIVAGSLFVVGEARSALTGAAPEALSLQDPAP